MRSALLASPALSERTYPGKPMALDYLAASLSPSEWEITTVDVDVQGLDAFLNLLRSKSFDLIGFTAMSIQIDAANSMALLSRELCPEAITIRGGAHDTAAFNEGCETHHELYDALVIGDGEDTLKEIAISRNRDNFLERRSMIKGIAYWDRGVHLTGHRGMTAHKGSPLRSFHHKSYDFEVLGGKKTAQVLAARGCNNACFYCSESVSQLGRREIRRPLPDLISELQILESQKFGAIYFDDPTFTRDRDFTLHLCDELRNWKFTWGCNTRVDCLDSELVKIMHRSGCHYLFCGLESAVPEVLRGLNKTNRPDLYLESAVEAYDALRNADLPSSAFLIFGGPRMEKREGRTIYTIERDEDIRSSLDFAVNTLDPDYLSMNILRLLPGLPLSFAAQFACLRPRGTDRIHGGHYDSTWYFKEHKQDLRSNHPIYRAFEGCGSVNPPHMTPERCYEILAIAVDMVNSKNAKPGKRQTQIVVDRRFSRFLRESNLQNYRRHQLASFAEIDMSTRWAGILSHVA